MRGGLGGGAALPASGISSQKRPPDNQSRGPAPLLNRPPMRSSALASIRSACSRVRVRLRRRFRPYRPVFRGRGPTCGRNPGSWGTGRAGSPVSGHLFLSSTVVVVPRALYRQEMNTALVGEFLRRVRRTPAACSPSLDVSSSNVHVVAGSRGRRRTSLPNTPRSSRDLIGDPIHVDGRGGDCRRLVTGGLFESHCTHAPVRSGTGLGRRGGAN